MTSPNASIPAAPFAEALAKTESFLGLFHSEAVIAISDGVLTPEERRRLTIRLRGISAEALSLASRLERGE